MSFSNKESGLTLLELVLVVIVLAILTGLIAPTIRSMIDDAKVARILETHKIFKKVIRNYYADSGLLPSVLLDQRRRHPNSKRPDGAPNLCPDIPRRSGRCGREGRPGLGWGKRWRLEDYRQGGLRSP